MNAPGIWAVVPVKSLARAKQRLSPMLTPRQRRLLVLAMLNDVLDALAGTPMLRGIMVISPDHGVGPVSAAAGAVCVFQAGDIGYAASADQAARIAAGQYGADGIMVVPADMPAATPEDFTAVLQAHAGPGCTIVPSWDGEGSNCVVLSPPMAMGFLFGPSSFRRHVEAASRAGIAATLVDRPSLSRDIDTPADLACLAGAACGAHVRHLLPSLLMPRLAAMPLARTLA